MWLNVSTETLNVMIQVLVIYRLIFLLRNSIIFNNQREQKKIIIKTKQNKKALTQSRVLKNITKLST